MAFRTQYIYFKYQVIPFELSNILASFQNYINKIFAKKFNFFIIVYLNNILIYIKNPGQSYIKTVRWVLNIFWRHGLFVNLKKCQFYKNKIRFLGYIVSIQVIRMKDK